MVPQWGEVLIVTPSLILLSAKINSGLFAPWTKALGG